MSVTDDLLKDLAVATAKPSRRNTEGRVPQLWMSSKKYQGNFAFIPFLDSNGKSWDFFHGTREIKLVEDNGYQNWYLLLTKDKYRNMTQEEEEAYDKAVGAWDMLFNTWWYEGIQRKKDYSVIHGWMLQHYDLSKNPVATTDKFHFLIFPSKNVSKVLNSSIQSMNSKVKNPNWIPQFYNSNRLNKIGYVSMGFERPKIGYEVSISHDTNSPIAKVIPDTFELSQEDMDKIVTNGMTLLGRSSGATSEANIEVFQRIYNYCMQLYNQKKVEIDSAEAKKEGESNEESNQPKNNNIQGDPMTQVNSNVGRDITHQSPVIPPPPPVIH